MALGRSGARYSFLSREPRVLDAYVLFQLGWFECTERLGVDAVIRAKVSVSAVGGESKGGERWVLRGLCCHLGELVQGH